MQKLWMHKTFVTSRKCARTKIPLREITVVSVVTQGSKSSL